MKNIFHSFITFIHYQFQNKEFGLVTNNLCPAWTLKSFLFTLTNDFLIIIVVWPIMSSNFLPDIIEHPTLSFCVAIVKVLT